MSQTTIKEGEELRFGEAIDRLESILRRVEAEEIDVDELADELREATRLLELCRGKIRKAEIEVTQIVQNLERDAEPDEAAAAGPDEAGG